MRNLFLVVILGGALSACAGVKGNISADECGCPEEERVTVLSQKQQGISADECGCPENDRKTKVVKDQDASKIAD